MSTTKPPLRIKLAQSKDELEQAYRLQQKSFYSYGFTNANHGVWLTKHHALPSTSTIVALEGERVVGAITIFGDSAFHLPIENRIDIKKLQHSMNGRLAEISAHAIDDDVKNKEDVAYALFHFAVCFSATFCHHSLLISCAPNQHTSFYADKLGFTPYLTKERLPGQVMTLYVLETSDYKQSMREGSIAEFEFPEKKLFLVNHHVMHPETLDYFFNRLTRIFSELNDMELRALKNMYEFGKYASVLPRRESAVQFKRLPKHKRFEMDCEGFLVLEDKRKLQFQILDVSASGLRLEADETLDPNKVYMLNISIGVMKNTEVIAKTIWVKPKLHHAGLEIQSADENWRKLIYYLENDFHRQAG